MNYPRKFHTDPWTHLRARGKSTCAHETLMCARTCLRMHMRFCLVRAFVCTDLYEILFGSLLLSYELRCKTSEILQHSLRRNLKNKKGIVFILNFQCNLHIFIVKHLKCLQRWIITEWLWNFLETIYQNAIDSGKI